MGEKPYKSYPLYVYETEGKKAYYCSIFPLREGEAFSVRPPRVYSRLGQARRVSITVMLGWLKRVQ